MLMILKNKNHALNKQCSELDLDHKKEKSISNDNNEQGNMILEICI